MSCLEPGPSGFQNVNSDEESDYFELNKKQKMCGRNSNDSEVEGNVSTSDNEVESEDIETTFEEEDSESDEELQCKELNKLVEGAGKWICDGDFEQFFFEGKTGFRNPPKGPDPCNVFDLLLDDSFLTMIVTETNKYTESKKSNQLKMLTVAEFRKFLGLLLHMGTIKCSKIQNYWSNNRLFNFTSFSQHMSWNRFQDILQSLNFASNNGSNNHLSEIEPVVDYFNNKMKAIYYPHKELSIDEIMVLWRKRLTFRQDIAGKKHKCGIKVHVLTESSGIALRIKIHTRSEDDISGKGRATQVVLCLLEDFLQRGHSVFMGNFYVSFMLSEYLLDAKTHCTGILQKFSKESSEEVVKAKLSKGEVISRYKNKIMMGKFRGKKDIVFISSEFKSDLVEVENKRKEKSKQPLVLHKYNEFTKGVSKKDQMLSYYTCSRRTFKWYIKLWIYIVETLLLNSFFLYSKYSPVFQKLNFYDFRLNIIDALLFENCQENTSVLLPETFAVSFLHESEHIPEILPRGKNNKVKRKRCRQCFANNVRTETNYFCGACEGNPGLCLWKCFWEFHQDK